MAGPPTAAVCFSPVTQARLDEEKNLLMRRQALFAKQQLNMDDDEHAKYLKFCEKTMWRIHIMEKRWDKHQEESLHKYAMLDLKLSQDPRLAPLLPKPMDA